jgi:hypothetical protein
MATSRLRHRKIVSWGSKQQRKQSRLCFCSLLSGKCYWSVRISRVCDSRNDSDKIGTKQQEQTEVASLAAKLSVA